jgi:PAS domain S-box-containing protein
MPPSQNGRVGSFLRTTFLRRFSSLLDAFPTGLHAIDRNGRIIMVNKRELEMLGYSEAEMIGRPFTDFIVQDQRAAAWSRFQQKLRGEKPEQTGDRLIVTKHGEQRYVTSKDTIYRDHRGRPYLIFTALTDITEVKRAQEQRMQQEKLVLAQELAKGVSHDLANLLTGVSGNAELAERLLGQMPPTEQQVKMGESLRTIREGAMRAGDLIARVRLFSRSQQAKVEFQPIMLAEPVRTVLQLFSGLLTNNGHCRISCELDEVLINGNKGDIMDAILNLLINARDAIGTDKPGEIKVVLTAATIEAPLDIVGGGELATGEFVVLSIADNGSGIPAELRDRVFEHGFTTKDQERNSGFGLPRVLATMTAHSGGVVLESEPGVGTTFRLYFPALK